MPSAWSFILFVHASIVAVAIVPLVFDLLSPSSILEQTLPPLHPSFIGRDIEVTNLKMLLNYSSSVMKIVTITGGPGVGKSELAICIGRELVGEGINVIYINVNQTANTISNWLEWSYSSHHKTLVIIDNWDQLPQAEEKEIMELLYVLTEHSTALKVLITSREHLLNHQAYPIDELSLSHACQLLNDTVTKSVTEQTCKEMVDIVGSIPLALHAIGELLDSLTPEELVLQLRKNLIETLSSNKLSPQLRANESLIKSYKDLAEDEQEVGRILSYFPKSFSTDIAVKIVPDKHNIIQKILQSLVAKSILNETVHDYGDFKIRSYNYQKVTKAFFKNMSTPREAKKLGISFMQYYKSMFQKITDKKTPFDLETFQHVLVNFLEFCKENLLLTDPNLIKVADSLSNGEYVLEDIEDQLQTLLSSIWKQWRTL